MYTKCRALVSNGYSHPLFTCDKDTVGLASYCLGVHGYGHAMLAHTYTTSGIAVNIGNAIYNLYSPAPRLEVWSCVNTAMWNPGSCSYCFDIKVCFCYNIRNAAGTLAKNVGLCSTTCGCVRWFRTLTIWGCACCCCCNIGCIGNGTINGAYTMGSIYMYGVSPDCKCVQMWFPDGTCIQRNLPHCACQGKCCICTTCYTLDVTSSKWY